MTKIRDEKNDPQPTVGQLTTPADARVEPADYTDTFHPLRRHASITSSTPVEKIRPLFMTDMERNVTKNRNRYAIGGPIIGQRHELADTRAAPADNKATPPR